MKDPTSLLIMGADALGLAWLWYATWQGIDPVGWLR